MQNQIALLCAKYAPKIDKLCKNNAVSEQWILTFHQHNTMKINVFFGH